MASTEVSAPVRSRVTVVCAECKRLKLKCDRRTPCASCVKRDTVPRCQYSQGANDKVDVQSLHNRLLCIEAIVSALANGFNLNVHTINQLSTAPQEMLPSLTDELTDQVKDIAQALYTADGPAPPPQVHQPPPTNLIAFSSPFATANPGSVVGTTVVERMAVSSRRRNGSRMADLLLEYSSLGAATSVYGGSSIYVSLQDVTRVWTDALGVDLHSNITSSSSNNDLGYARIGYAGYLTESGTESDRGAESSGDNTRGTAGTAGGITVKRNQGDAPPSKTKINLRPAYSEFDYTTFSTGVLGFPHLTASAIPQPSKDLANVTLAFQLFLNPQPAPTSVPSSPFLQAVQPPSNPASPYPFGQPGSPTAISQPQFQSFHIPNPAPAPPSSSTPPGLITPAHIALLPPVHLRHLLLTEFEQIMLLHPCFSVAEMRRRVDALFRWAEIHTTDNDMMDETGSVTRSDRDSAVSGSSRSRVSKSGSVASARGAGSVVTSARRQYGARSRQNSSAAKGKEREKENEEKEVYEKENLPCPTLAFFAVVCAMFAVGAQSYSAKVLHANQVPGSSQQNSVQAPVAQPAIPRARTDSNIAGNSTVANAAIERADSRQRQRPGSGMGMAMDTEPGAMSSSGGSGPENSNRARLNLANRKRTHTGATTPNSRTKRLSDGLGLGVTMPPPPGNKNFTSVPPSPSTRHANPVPAAAAAAAAQLPLQPLPANCTPSHLYSLYGAAMMAHDILSFPPSLDYLIAHILSWIYLMHPSSVGGGATMIDPDMWKSLGKVVNVARGMGLGVDPDDGILPRSMGRKKKKRKDGATTSIGEPNGMGIWEKEMRRRVWWDLCYYDLFISDCMGLPPLIDDAQHSCKMPSDVDESAFGPTSRNLPPPIHPGAVIDLPDTEHSNGADNMDISGNDTAVPDDPGDDSGATQRVTRFQTTVAVGDGTHFSYFVQKCKLVVLMKSFKKRTFRDPQTNELSLEAARAFEAEVQTYLSELPKHFALNFKLETSGRDRAASHPADEDATMTSGPTSAPMTRQNTNTSVAGSPFPGSNSGTPAPVNGQPSYTQAASNNDPVIPSSTVFPQSDVIAAQACELHTMASLLILKLWHPFLVAPNSPTNNANSRSSQQPQAPPPQPNQAASLACATAAHAIIVASHHLLNRFRHIRPATYGFYGFGRGVFHAGCVLANIVITSPGVLFAEPALKGLAAAVEIMKDPVVAGYMGGRMRGTMNVPGTEVHQPPLKPQTTEALRILEKLLLKANNIHSGEISHTGAKRKYDAADDELNEDGLRLSDGFQLPYAGGAIMTSEVQQPTVDDNRGDRGSVVGSVVSSHSDRMGSQADSGITAHPRRPSSAASSTKSSVTNPTFTGIIPAPPMPPPSLVDIASAAAHFSATGLTHDGPSPPQQRNRTVGDRGGSIGTAALWHEEHVLGASGVYVPPNMITDSPAPPPPAPSSVASYGSSHNRVQTKRPSIGIRNRNVTSKPQTIGTAGLPQGSSHDSSKGPKTNKSGSSTKSKHKKHGTSSPSTTTPTSSAQPQVPSHSHSRSPSVNAISRKPSSSGLGSAPMPSHPLPPHSLDASGSFSQQSQSQPSQMQPHSSGSFNGSTSGQPIQQIQYTSFSGYQPPPPPPGSSTAEGHVMTPQHTASSTHQTQDYAYSMMFNGGGGTPMMGASSSTDFTSRTDYQSYTTIR
ncbi:hypothetical protein FRC02_000523 [Tulasnella sp. 418]|nr:hypothetical protein FRC02_000523 [Tulasnella sp. 418]